MLEITGITSRIRFAGKCTILYGTLRKKFTKADVMKRVMREHKQCFGSLLETKKEKDRRVKREIKAGVSHEEQVSVEQFNSNSEWVWMTKVSDARLRRIRRTEPSVDTAPELAIKLNKGKFFEPLALREAQIATATRDSRRLRFQKRIIRKNNESATAIVKQPFLEVVNVAPMKIPKFAPKLDKELNEKTEKSKKTPETPKSKMKNIGSSKSGDSKDDTKEAKFHRVKEPPLMISRSQVMVENIEKAKLLFKDNKESNAWQQSSKILSVSMAEIEESLVLPGVTKILNVTMSERAKKMLELWMARMIRDLGQEAFDEYKRDLLESGKLFHSAIDNSLRKLPIQVPEKLKPCFDSVRSVLKEVKDVRAIESHVVHQDLGYRGVLDCVALYKENLCLIDWKKSDNMKNLLSSTYDAPLQLASYIGALNADKNYPFQIKSGLLVIAYTRGNPPTVYQLNEMKLQYYWEQWLQRLKKYYTMRNT